LIFDDTFIAKKVLNTHQFGQIMLLPPSLDEMKDTEPLHFEQIAPEAVKQAIEKIDQAIKNKEVDKKVKQKINYAKKNWLKWSISKRIRISI